MAVWERADPSSFPCNQHTEDIVMVDERYAEKGLEPFVPCFGRSAVARVSRCIGQNHQLSPFAKQARQADLQTGSDLASRCAARSSRCHQDTLTGLGAGQMYGADIGR
jgi:hypothetical protein